MRGPFWYEFNCQPYKLSSCFIGYFQADLVSCFPTECQATCFSEQTLLLWHSADLGSARSLWLHTREVPQSVNCELNLNRGGGLLQPNNKPSMRGIKTRFLGAALSLKVMDIHSLLALCPQLSLLHSTVIYTQDSLGCIMEHMDFNWVYACSVNVYIICKF